MSKYLSPFIKRCFIAYVKNFDSSLSNHVVFPQSFLTHSSHCIQILTEPILSETKINRDYFYICVATDGQVRFLFVINQKSLRFRSHSSAEKLQNSIFVIQRLSFWLTSNPCLNQSLEKIDLTSINLKAKEDNSYTIVIEAEKTFLKAIRCSMLSPPTAGLEFFGSKYTDLLIQKINISDGSNISSGELKSISHSLVLHQTNPQHKLTHSKIIQLIPQESISDFSNEKIKKNQKKGATSRNNSKHQNIPKCVQVPVYSYFEQEGGRNLSLVSPNKNNHKEVNQFESYSPSYVVPRFINSLEDQNGQLLNESQKLPLNIQVKHIPIQILPS